MFRLFKDREIVQDRAVPHWLGDESAELQLAQRNRIAPCMMVAADVPLGENSRQNKELFARSDRSRSKTVYGKRHATRPVRNSSTLLYHSAHRPITTRPKTKFGLYHAFLWCCRLPRPPTRAILSSLLGRLLVAFRFSECRPGSTG